jgi:carnitine O-acetyltransferase
MDASDPGTGQPLPLDVLERGLRDVVDRASRADRRRHRHRSSLPDLGWLTHSNRDDWAAARTALLEGRPSASSSASASATKDALDLLESAAFCVCLDDDAAPVSRAECAEHFWHGGRDWGRNRWMDKSIQLIVTANGKAGLVGEHSMCVAPWLDVGYLRRLVVLASFVSHTFRRIVRFLMFTRMDGMPVVGLADYLTKVTYGTCDGAAARGGGDCNVRGIFDGLDLSEMEPYVEKGTICQERLSTRE